MAEAQVAAIPAALVAFALLMSIAMYDRWTPTRLAIYSAVGFVVVFGFYVLFARFLLVPLPKGWLFQG